MLCEPPIAFMCCEACKGTGWWHVYVEDDADYANDTNERCPYCGGGGTIEYEPEQLEMDEG
jgi:DnaJ-class molecular chaperone